MIKATKNNPDSTGKTNPDSNPDPITGAPGSHPIGTGIGAAAAGAAGAAIGSVVPGIGTAIGGVVGAAVGAIAGGLAGKGLAEVVDPTTENNYWRNEYRNRKYYDSALDYDTDFAPAYRYGWDAYRQYAARSPRDVDDELREGWTKNRGTSRLEWDRAQHAVHDAWDRMHTASSRHTSDPSSGTSAADANRSA